MGIAEKRPQGDEMDNPATESTALNMDSAAAAFGDLLSPPEPDKEEGAPVEAEAVEPEAVEVETEEAADDPLVTIKVDGKDIQVPLSELKNGYQRQADYTRKTMEVAEQRKAAEAEATKAQQERQQYATNLQENKAKLEAFLQVHHSNTDWDYLWANNRPEYERQRGILEQGQAELARIDSARTQLDQVTKAEQERLESAYVQQQQEELLAKLPEWKDPKKAQAEQAEIIDWLVKTAGLPYEQVAITYNPDGTLKSRGITNHQHVLIARKAMLYDRMVEKAQAATKRVSTLPTKVEKPGSGANPNLDRRTSDFQRLSKSGSIDDAARVFGSFL